MPAGPRSTLARRSLDRVMPLPERHDVPASSASNEASMTVVEPRDAHADPTVDALAALFHDHPAWIQAARHLADRAESAVSFTHRPGEHWRLVRRSGQTLLLPGLARDPDLAFRFTPASVACLAAVEGGVGDFAVELFARVVDPSETEGIGLRVVAPFTRLARRGYVRLLLTAGPQVAAFGAARGVRTLGDLRRLLRRLRDESRAGWVGG
jgi:hypothetical protein